MAGLTLLLGGVRAGKSAKALALASASDRGRGVLFVATAQPFDEEMARLLELQNAYSANARVISAVQDLMSKLLDL